MSRAIDTAALRDAAPHDDNSPLGCVVALHEGSALHWEVNVDGDLVIQVLTHTHQTPIEAFLAGVGLSGRGVWYVPEIGTEGVLVLDAEGEATFLPRASRGPAPQGLAAGKVSVVGTDIEVLADGEAHVRATEINLDDGGGGNEPLVKGTSHNAALGPFATAARTFANAVAVHSAPLGPYPDPVLNLAALAFQAAADDLSSALPGLLTTVVTAK